MYKPEYGDPVFTVRLPRTYHAALKALANKQQSSAAAIVRELIKDELKLHGFALDAKPIEGQVKFE